MAALFAFMDARWRPGRLRFSDRFVGPASLTHHLSELKNLVTGCRQTTFVLMGRSVVISPLNVYSFRRSGTRPAQYHRGHLDDSLQQELIRADQVGGVYTMPVERGDRFRLMLDATANTGVTVDIVDCRLNVFAVLAAPTSLNIPGNVTSDGTQLTSYLFREADLSAVAADGYYYIRIQVTWATGDPYIAISEPFHLAGQHPDTMLIEYQHSENKDHAWFENLPVRFGIRVAGFIDDLETMTSGTVFQDQEYNTVPLDDNAFRNWTMFIEPVANYMRDKLNQIFTLNYKLIDGKEYTKASESAKFEKEGAVTSSLWGSSLLIQEADRFEGNVYEDPTLRIYTTPAYPFAIGALSIAAGSLTAQLIPANVTGYVLDDAAKESAMITALQAGRSSRELYGSVVKVTGDVNYTNGPGEKYRTASAQIFPTFFGFSFISSGAYNPPFGGVVYPSLPLSFISGAGLVDWGDGTIEAIPSSVSGLATLTHLYTGPAGTYQVRIFGKMEHFGVSGSRSGLAGTLPAGLKSLSIYGGSFPANTFNFSILDPVKSTLQSLSIQNAQLTAANGFNSFYMPSLYMINFSGNAFSSQVMGAFMFDVHKNASNSGSNNPVISSGTFSIGGQTTNAGLNAQGKMFKALLENAPFNWTINS